MQTLFKQFSSEQDHPPLFQKISTFSVFGFLFIIQYLTNLVYQLLPRRVFLLKIAACFQIASLDVIKRYKYEDDLPPLKCTRKTKEDQLAGFKHELGIYPPVLNSFQALYNTAAYSRFKMCFHREIISCPTDVVQIRTDVGELNNVINTCSYNYLGFASTKLGVEQLCEYVDKNGIGQFINRSKTDLPIIDQLEKKMTSYLGTEDCIIHFMGYDTNAMSIPCIADKNCLILCDQFNHNSIVKGCKYSGAHIVKFRHDNLNTLETALESINFSKYKLVLVIVEGLYSMEGSFVDLPKIIELKKKYPFLLYVDEAHSIGALGKHGRGIVDYYNLNRSDVDFSMGTFTKSFSSVGGYIAGRKDLIDLVRNNAKYYQTFVGVSGIFAQQILNVLDSIDSDVGYQKLEKLKENSIYFRKCLHNLGFTVYGNFDSPVVPVLFYNPIKMKFISEEFLKRNIAAVVVGFPAVPLLSARMRFCISASHTKDELDYILNHIDQIGDYMAIKFEK